VLSGEYSLSNLYDPELLIAVGAFALFIVAGKWLSARLTKPRDEPANPAGKT
jgi:hypothetical protein